MVISTQLVPWQEAAERVQFLSGNFGRADAFQKLSTLPTENRCTDTRDERLSDSYKVSKPTRERFSTLVKQREPVTPLS